jgi:hypothetical protein
VRDPGPGELLPGASLLSCVAHVAESAASSECETDLEKSDGFSDAAPRSRRYSLSTGPAIRR